MKFRLIKVFRATAAVSLLLLQTVLALLIGRQGG